MQASDIQHVTILGAGTMGQEIGLLTAVCGYRVTMYDINEAALRTALERQKALLRIMNKMGYLDAAENEGVLGRLRFTADAAQAAEDVDLVSESVPEVVQVKEGIYRQFAGLWPERTILTTNTSTLLPSMFAEATGRPAKFMALHFHPHVWISNVADVMPHLGTAPETVQLVQDFAVRIRQIPILLQKESPGYVFNAMLKPLLNAAAGLVARGVATPEDVDRAFMGIMRTKLGPMGMMDLIGLDTVYRVTVASTELPGAAPQPGLPKILELVQGMMDAGHLGIKTGRGFYEYPNPTYTRPDFLT
jgi:3-hydroxybutyryl-CoA dehydrogenase